MSEMERKSSGQITSKYTEVFHPYVEIQTDNKTNANNMMQENAKNNSTSNTTVNNTSEKQSLNRENPLRNILKVVAFIIYICGFISGIVLGNSIEYDTFYFGVAFVCWISAFISGTLILAVSEVINLLQKILDKNASNQSRVNNQTLSSNQNSNFDASVQKIKEIQYLFDAGVLTKEEFENEKSKIIGVINKDLEVKN